MCAPSHLANPRHRSPACASDRRHGHTALLVVRILVTFALALVLLIQVPSAGPRTAPLAAPPIGGPVTFRTDATAVEITRAAAELLAAYDSFALARGLDRALA